MPVTCHRIQYSKILFVVMLVYIGVPCRRLFHLDRRRLAQMLNETEAELRAFDLAHGLTHPSPHFSSCCRD